MASRLVVRSTLTSGARRIPGLSFGASQRHFSHTSWLSDYNQKYADKIRKAAEKRGKSVDDLRAELHAQELEKKKERLKAAAEAIVNAHSTTSASTSSGTAAPTPGISQRADSSPVKPLSTILNLARLLEKPHTAEQVSVLWHTYHASRSKGTGRGYLCASVPVDAYEKMLSTARAYPSFVVPLVRMIPGEGEGAAGEKAYEFYFMQWALHGSPPVPTYESETALFPGTSPPTGTTGAANPPTATVLLTPLQEYKLRQTFATPYLSLTFYPDLAASHGVVLLRGELTPSAVGAPAADQGGDGNFFLSQQDAQMLAMSVQRFYLWSEGKDAQAREELLRAFHEKPEEFRWEELLKHAEVA